MTCSEAQTEERETVTTCSEAQTEEKKTVTANSEAQTESNAAVATTCSGAQTDAASVADADAQTDLPAEASEEFETNDLDHDIDHEFDHDIDHDDDMDDDAVFDLSADGSSPAASATVAREDTPSREDDDASLVDDGSVRSDDGFDDGFDDFESDRVAADDVPRGDPEMESLVRSLRARLEDEPSEYDPNRPSSRLEPEEDDFRDFRAYAPPPTTTRRFFVETAYPPLPADDANDSFGTVDDGFGTFAARVRRARLDGDGDGAVGAASELLRALESYPYRYRSAASYSRAR